MPTTRQIYTKLETLPPSEANHATIPLKRMFTWGKQTGRIDTFPHITKPNKETSRDRVLSLEELAAIWHATEQHTTYNLLVRLLILTGQRRGEIATINRTTLQNNTTTWNTTKNRKPHTVPLSSYSMQLTQKLITSMKTSSTPYSTWSKPKTALDKASGVTNWTLHDIRRSVATHMSKELKVDYLTIEALLNHTPQGVRGVYNRDDRMEEMRDALYKWELFVLALPRPGNP
jgi:integrase